MNEYPPCDHPYEGWFVDGVPLSGEGFLLAQFVETVPPRRGQDVIAARRPGSIRQPKVYGSRVQTLVLWALKQDEFGNVSGGVERNVDRLKRLFGGGVADVELTRRISLPFGRVSTRRADVELVDALEGQRTSLTQTGNYVQFAVDLLFHDPFWYEPRNELLGQSSEYGPFQLWNPGTVTSRDALIRIFGPAVDPEVTFEPSGSSVTFSGEIEQGGFVEIDSYNYTAVDEEGTSVAGLLTRNRDAFVEVSPGRNEVSLSDGTCDVRWRPTFL